MQLSKQHIFSILYPDEQAAKPCVIRAINVTQNYQTARSVVRALRGVTLDVYKGEYLCIIGASGSGKTTLFNAIGALQRPSSGKIYIDQVDIAQLDHNELAWLRCRKVGYVFQGFNLIAELSALENVVLPMPFAGTRSRTAQKRAEQLLELVGLQDRMHHRPVQLSGGQQQRVAIARALANNPKVILADEPTANLDRQNAQSIIELLNNMKKTFGVTIVCATHDEYMLRSSDRIFVLEEGRIVNTLHPEDIDLPE